MYLIDNYVAKVKRKEVVVMSPDALFKKEFMQTMHERKMRALNFHIREVVIPEKMEEKRLPKPECVYKVRGVVEPYFSKLNGKVVEKYTEEVRKRQLTSTGEFRKEKGKYVYDEVVVPINSMCIVSSVTIQLRNVIQEVGRPPVAYNPSEGFRYVDYIEDTNGGRRYIYIIPKDYLVPLDLCALVLTPNTHRDQYKGLRVALANGHYVNLYVIPYKHQGERGYRVLDVKPTTNFDVEIKALLEFWVRIGVMFNPEFAHMDEAVRGGKCNLVIEDLVGSRVQ